jgi:F-type H+-transporting ATPase subunit gamma
MQFVATAKLQKLQRLVLADQAYADQLQALLHRVAGAEEVEHPYVVEREVRRVGLVVMAGDRGLCGAFNQQLLRMADAVVERLPAPPLAVTVGLRAERWANRRNVEVAASFAALSDVGAHSPAAALGRAVRGLYDSGQVDQIQVVSEEFHSILRHHPVTRQLLPLSPGQFQPGGEGGTYYEFMPPAPELLAVLLPRAVDAVVMYMALGTHTSEQAARMTAMRAATDNAQEMITDLTRRLNRARQTMITSEIMDVVGGANALGAL